MGRTYEAVNKGCPGRRGDRGSFDVNFAGADVLGIIMKTVGRHDRKIEAENAGYGINNRLPTTRFELTEAEAKEHASRVRALTGDQLQDIHARATEIGLWEGPVEDFISFVADWGAFLDCCKGYKVN